MGVESIDHIVEITLGAVLWGPIVVAYMFDTLRDAQKTYSGIHPTNCESPYQNPIQLEFEFMKDYK